MTADPLSHHEHRHRFDAALEEIRSGLVRMGSVVAENVLRAGEAMRESRLDLVPQVRAADQEVNALYEKLEKLAFETVAREQPVATDLRFLISATRILYELERSGDLAVNCANILERLGGLPESPRLLATLDRLVHLATEVFSMGIDAVADMPADAGEALDKADDAVDELVGRFYTEIGQESQDIGLDAAIALSRVGRFMERVADHAVNIGEHITWVVTAEFPGDAKGDPGDAV
jgi:phosphate transport system protein